MSKVLAEDGDTIFNDPTEDYLPSSDTNPDSEIELKKQLWDIAQNNADNPLKQDLFDAPLAQLKHQWQLEAISKLRNDFIEDYDSIDSSLPNESYWEVRKWLKAKATNPDTKEEIE